MSYTLEIFSNRSKPITPLQLSKRIAKDGWGILFYNWRAITQSTRRVTWVKKEFEIRQTPRSLADVAILALPLDNPRLEEARELLVDGRQECKDWLNQSWFAGAELSISNFWKIDSDVRDEWVEDYGEKLVSRCESCKLAYFIRAAGSSGWPPEGENIHMNDGQFILDLKAAIIEMTNAFASDDDGLEAER